MSDIDAKFQKAVAIINAKPKPGQKKLKVDMKTKLTFYALYKQATEGPCKGAKPSRTAMVDYYKWMAWTKCGQMSKAQAKEKYLATAMKFMPADVKSKL